LSEKALILQQNLSMEQGSMGRRWGKFRRGGNRWFVSLESGRCVLRDRMVERRAGPSCRSSVLDGSTTGRIWKALTEASMERGR